MIAPFEKTDKNRTFSKAVPCSNADQEFRKDGRLLSNARFIDRPIGKPPKEGEASFPWYCASHGDCR
jgi:hypothetical protein